MVGTMVNFEPRTGFSWTVNPSELRSAVGRGRTSLR